jgi:hypothetical protein
MLPQLAKGDANKVFVIPSEFSEAFGGIGRAFMGGGAAGREVASGGAGGGTDGGAAGTPGARAAPPPAGPQAGGSD